MKHYNPTLLIVLALLIGCSHKAPPTSPKSLAFDLRDYIPQKAGTSWKYSSSSQLANGLLDTTLSSSVDLSVFQTNTLIGGQPNAFVLRATDEAGQARYLAFYLDPTTLWHYLGGTVALPVQPNIILWLSGGVGGALVGVHQAQTYSITDRSALDNSYSIQRSPDPSVALAKMTAQDSVQISGVAEGASTFCLRRDGGASSDTMTVLVESTNNQNPTISFLPPWIPLWQLTNSPTGQIMFSWDTTYTFRRLSDSALCRDDLQYLVTNRRIGEDRVSALNTSLTCDKFEMTIDVAETVTYTDNLGTSALYQGPSTHFVVETWLAKGIGFIKGTIDGASRYPGVTMAGSKDSNGVLQGYYLSPRVTYAGMINASTSSRDYFRVDDTPLGPNSTSESFILMEKNF